MELPNDSVELNTLIDQRIGQYLQNQGFSSRKVTDTPTDALSVVNKKYVDGRTCCARIYLSSDQTLTEHSTPYDLINLDAQAFKNGMTTDLVNHKIIVNTAGYYGIYGQVFQTSASDAASFNLIQARIAINGTEVGGYGAATTSQNSNNNSISYFWIANLSVNDYIQLHGYGRNQINNGGADGWTYLQAFKI